RAALALTVAMVALFAILANRADEQRRLIPSIFEQSGILTDTDLKYGDEGRTLDVWLIQLDAGQTLRVDLQSKDFTPFFYITGPLSLHDPPRVADSVASGETSAHAEFSPASVGEYGLAVLSIGPTARGSYE